MKTMSSIWVSKLEKELIELFQPHTSIWDVSDPLYKKNIHRKLIINDITERLRKRYPQYAMDMNPDSILKKINSLKSYYRKEIKKIKFMRGNGVNYVSRWEHFARLSFLGDNSTISKNSERSDTSQETMAEAKAPLIVSLNHSRKKSQSVDSEEESDAVMKWQPSTNLTEILNTVKSSDQNQSLTPSAENIDHMFGHFVISIMKSIPENKKKDEMRMKIIQDLFKLKNS